ncbi:MAG: hypothetical protein ACPGRX_04710 [Bdellovibrionales bacterium]
MSKFLLLVFGFIVLAAIGGFVYLAVTDIPVEQTPVSSERTLAEITRGDGA